MFPFLSWCIFGLFVGAIARLLLPGRYPIGCLPTIGLGVLGSIVGGFVWHVLLRGDPQYQPGGYLLSIVGAMVVLYLADRLGRGGRGY